MPDEVVVLWRSPWWCKGRPSTLHCVRQEALDFSLALDPQNCLMGLIIMRDGLQQGDGDKTEGLVKLCRRKEFHPDLGPRGC